MYKEDDDMDVVSSISNACSLKYSVSRCLVLIMQVSEVSAVCVCVFCTVCLYSVLCSNRLTLKCHSLVVSYHMHSPISRSLAFLMSSSPLNSWVKVTPFAPAPFHH